MRRLYLLILFFCFSGQLYGQTWEWVKQFQTNSEYLVFASSCLDAQENFVAVCNKDYTSQSDIIKVDNVGNQLWKMSTQCSFHKIICDKANNYYLCGTFNGSVTMASSTFSVKHSTGIVAKMNSQGSFLWAVVPDTACNQINSITINSQNEMFAIGGSGYSAESVMYMVKMDLAGSVNSKHAYPNAIPYDISSDQSNNLYIHGVYYDTLRLNSSVALYQHQEFGNDFTAKYEYNKDFKWAKEYGVSYYARYANMNLDNQPNVYFSRWMRYDAFRFIKHDGEGTEISNQAVGGSVYDINCNGMAINSDNSVMLTGERSSYSEFNSDHNHLFVYKYKASGTEDWHLFVNNARGLSIASRNNKYYIIGELVDTTTFAGKTFYSANGKIFIAKLSEQCVPPVVGFTPMNAVCKNSPAFPLNGGTPNGGTYNGPGVINNVFHPEITGSGEFTITYSYTDVNGCSATAQQTMKVNDCATTDIALLNNNEVKIFPNPTNGRITVDFGKNEGNKNLKVYDISGRIVTEFQVSGSKFEIDLSGQAKGIYFIEITAGEERIKRKVVLN